MADADGNHPTAFSLMTLAAISAGNIYIYVGFLQYPS